MAGHEPQVFRMWAKLYQPEIVLPPKHARIYREAVSYFSDQIGWEDWEEGGFEIGIGVFDRLTQGQKQAALLQVARALLCEGAEAPDVTAALAGTVDAVYRTLEGMIAYEIEESGETEIRRMVLDAMDEADYWESVNDGLLPGEQPVVRLSHDCPDLGEWEELIESLRTTVLDDYDFDMDDLFGDADPDTANQQKLRLGIADDYFTVVPEDPNPSRLEVMRRELYALVRWTQE